jgi:ankyrin repeat protein
MLKRSGLLIGMVFVVIALGFSFAQAKNEGASANPDKTELFLKAASTGDVKTLEAMVNEDHELVYAKSEKDGKTALHRACVVGKYDAVKLLLNKGADFRAKDNNRKTALYYAKAGRWYEVCYLLTKKGAKY